jgi:hypothetical protein
MILLGASVAGLPPGQQRDREHARRQRREREARLERVVLEHHLEVDRERDHHPAERDLLERLARDSEAEVHGREEADVEERGLSVALPPLEPPDQGPEGDQSQGDEGADSPAAFLPDEDP